MAIQTLNQIYKEKGHEFIEKLFNKYVIISEKINGSRFVFNKIDDNFNFFKANNNEITIIERTIMQFYENGINYIENLSNDIKDSIPDNWYFGFQYFPSNNPILIQYDFVPKNNLVLTDIVIKNDSNNTLKIIKDPEILIKWANKLGVQEPPYIYKGKLTDDQKTKLFDYLNSNEDDLEKLFNHYSFTRFMISTLNPSLTHSTLQKDIDKGIEGLIFSFKELGENEFIDLKIIDPIIKTIQKDMPKRKPNDIYQVAMLDIIEYIGNLKLTDYAIESTDVDEKYIELISQIFNDYISDNGHKYIGVNFETPEFATKEEFNINLDYIKNDRTKAILKNENLHDLYKIFITSFKKKRKSNTDILTDNVIGLLNDIISEIEEITEGRFNENIALSYTDFIKYRKGSDSIFENEIFEALQIDSIEHGNEKVNIIVGRFQPFTLGHVKVFEQIHKQNSYPVVVFLVRGKKSDKDKNPFDVSTQERMFAAMKTQYKFLKEIKVIPTAGIDKIFNALRPAYEPVLWGAGTDRIKGYNAQITRYWDELNSLEDFKMYEIKRTDSNISATKVRNALIIDDEDSFKDMTPKSIHNFYNELKVELGVGIMESYDINTNLLNEDVNSEIEKLQRNVAELDLTKKQDLDISSRISSVNNYVENFIPLNNIKNVFVNEKGFSETDYETILKFLKSDSIESLINLSTYLENPLTIDDFTKITQPTNISNLLSKRYNISESTLSKIFSIDGKMKSGKGVGRGELFLGLMIKDATNASIGDVNVNGNPFEVKADQARLNTQNGFGIGLSAFYSFFNKLSEIDSLLGKKYGELNKKNVQSYNFYKSNNSKLNNVFEDAVKLNKLNDVINAFVNTAMCGPSGIWPNSDNNIKNSIINAIKTNIGKDGIFKDIDDFNYKMMYINILYYQSQEFFNGIFLINPNNSNFMYFNPNEQDYRDLKKYTKYTQPSFQDNPTSMCYKISLK